MSAPVKRLFQRGFTLVSAIFILVVLAGLGAAILMVSTSQHMGSALDLQGAQAYQAARAGIEWGLWQRQRNGAAYACVSPLATTFTPPAAAGSLVGFRVTVTCGAFADASSTPPILVYEIEAIACNRAACPAVAPGANYVERRLKVTL